MAMRLRWVACLVLIGAQGTADVVLHTDWAKLILADDGSVVSLTSKPDGIEYLAAPAHAFTLLIDGQEHPSQRIEPEGDSLKVAFEGTRVAAEFSVRQASEYIALTLRSLSDPVVQRVDLLRLHVKPMPRRGPWINIAYGDEYGVCLCGGTPNVNAVMSTVKQPPGIDMSTSAYAETGLEGATGVLIGCPEPQARFLDFMQVVEADLGLPPGAAGRKSDEISYSYMWVAPTVDTIDELIRWAKRGGFRMMLLSYTSFSKSCGHYEWTESFPGGMADLKAITDKIRAAGLAVGLHIHYNKAHKHDPYVTPRPDDRLHLSRSFSLAEKLDAVGDAIIVTESPEGCTRDDGRRVLKLGKELVEYTDYTVEAPYRFVGCTRGALGTQAVPHAAGAAVGLLDVDTWPIFIRFDQDTAIQDETAARIADICDGTGPYDMIYFDGAEDIHAPRWYHTSNAAWRVYRGIRPAPKVCEAAATSHFGWHMMTRSNAYDSVAPSAMKDFCRKAPCRTAPRRALDFTKINFGWLHGFSRSDGDHITPDVLEFVLSRGAAWDCPFSMTVSLQQLAANPLAEDCFDTIRLWEDVRIEGKLSPAQTEALKDLSGEHHLLVNEKGEHELVAIRPLDGVGQGRARPCYLFTREAEPGAAYALLAEPDSIELLADFPVERLKLMRPFGEELPLTEVAGKALIPVQSRRYLRFAGATTLEAGAVLQRAVPSLPPVVTHWLSAGDFAGRQGKMALGSEIGLKPRGAIGDVLVPNGPGDMTGATDWHVDYQFEAPTRSRWYMWARCWYEDTGSNSFFLSFPQVGRTKTRFGNTYVWHEWLWERAEAARLPEGTATFRLSVREALPGKSPLLDAICVTNDPRYRPTDEDAREALSDR